MLHRVTQLEDTLTCTAAALMSKSPVIDPGGKPAVFADILDQMSLQVVSSAIVDKYIGESARLIRELFGYAKDHQPCIIFMDEIDAIGGKRFSEGTSADREIQRTLMELLSQLDGFDVIGKVSRGQVPEWCASGGRDSGHAGRPSLLAVLLMLMI